MRQTITITLLMIVMATASWAALTKSNPLVDFTRFVSGKTFPDGRKLIASRKDGAKLSYVFRSGTPTQVIFTSKNGKETYLDLQQQQQRLQIAPYSATVTVTSNTSTPGADCTMTTPWKTWKFSVNGKPVEITWVVVEDCTIYNEWAEAL